MTTNTVSLEEAILAVNNQLEGILNGPTNLDAIRGRSGDRLIIQIKSEIGSKPSHRETLRTLGLHGRGSISLVTLTPSVAGAIRSVQHLVVVVELPNMCYNVKQYEQVHGDLKVKYEYLPYGTPSRPAAMYRADNSEYLSYESDRRGLLIAWSTKATVEEYVEHCRDVFPGDVEAEEPSALLAYTPAGEDIDYDVEAMSPAQALEIVATQSSSISLARIALCGAELTWLAPRRPFDDRPFITAEAQVWGPTLDLRRARLLADRTGPANLLNAANVTVNLRYAGGRSTKPF